MYTFEVGRKRLFFSLLRCMPEDTMVIPIKILCSEINVYLD